MATFEVNYRVGSDVKSVMLTAYDEKDAGKVFRLSNQGISADDVVSVRNVFQYHPKYGAANFVATLVSFGGWILLVFGVVGTVAGLLIAQQLVANAHGFDPAKQMFVPMALGGAYLSFVVALIGLLMAAVGQHLRATTDTANCLGEILVLMKSGIAASLPQPTPQVAQQDSTARICSGCSAAVADVGSAFCTQCGAKL